MEKKNPNLIAWILVILMYYWLVPSNSIYLITPIRTGLLIFLNIIYIYFNYKRLNIVKWPIIIFVIGFIICNFLSIISNNQLLKNDFQYIYEINIICIFCCLPLKNREYVFYLFVRIGAIYLTAAVCEFILYNYFNIGFLLREHIERGEGSTQFYSHGLLNVYQEGELILRFQALFREPGYLGIVAALILFAKNQ